MEKAIFLCTRMVPSSSSSLVNTFSVPVAPHVSAPSRLMSKLVPQGSSD